MPANDVTSNKYTILLEQLRVTDPERFPTPPPPNYGITDVEIGAILGLPPGQAMTACERAGLEKVKRGKGHPFNVCCNEYRAIHGTGTPEARAAWSVHVCDVDSERWRFRELDVRAMKARWDTGVESHLLDISEISAILELSGPTVRQTLLRAGVGHQVRGREHLWFRHEIQPLLDAKIAADDGSTVDVYEVAASLGCSVSKARGVVARWTPVGKVSSGSGAPRIRYRRADMLAYMDKNQDKQRKIDALRNEFEAKLAALSED